MSFQVLVEKMGLPEASRGVGSSKTDLLGKGELGFEMVLFIYAVATFEHLVLTAALWLLLLLRLLPAVE